MDAPHEQLKAEEAHVSSGLKASTDRALVEKLGIYAQKYSLVTFNNCNCTSLTVLRALNFEKNCPRLAKNVRLFSTTYSQLFTLVG